MALANIACSFASKGRKVLMVDWDLEAPGLHHYFSGYKKRTAANPGGTIGLLEAMADDGTADSSPFESSVTVPKTEFFPGCQIDLLAAGMESENYEGRVLRFSPRNFYREKQGASKLEALRQSWRERFDFVLIDSRTGITDIGGICTVFLPDILALVFTPNEQSFSGIMNVAERARKRRQTLSFDRSGLTIFPIPSRLDFRTEVEEADRWMKRFADELSPFLSDWCPRDVSVEAIFERVRVPHVAYFSFGEKLPTVTHSPSNTDLPGYSYENIVRVLEEEFSEHAILSVLGITRELKKDISRIARYAPAELIGRNDELELLDNAWLKVRRGESRRSHMIVFVALGGEGKTSLVAKWAAELAYRGWPDCEAAFAWSFYTQGTREQSVASSDLFLVEAITFFGNEADKQFATSNASAFEKGQRLARLIGERRSLLILDGLESRQYAPTAATPGQLKDPGLSALLRGLATDSRGLCIVTSRYSVPDLKAFWNTTATEIELTCLSRDAGVLLLKTLGVKGAAKEFETLVDDVKGHALTLNLFGTYLRDAHGGDIRRRDLVNLEEADEEAQGGQAFRLMEEYVRALASEGEKGKSALAILMLLGLFDRPATIDLIQTLGAPPVIQNLTEPLVKLSSSHRNVVLKRLEETKLVMIKRDASGTLISVDTHPLVREYCSFRLRLQQPEAWRVAHLRIYEHLCATTRDKDQPTLEDLQPLCQAVNHGCQAGLQQETCDEIYYGRINRGQQFYLTKKLGAFACGLGVVACFFDEPWSRVSPQLDEASQAWLLAVAAFYLRALGRLAEALQPMRAGLKGYLRKENWRAAAITASNLSQLELALGQTLEAVKDAEQSVNYVDRSSPLFQRVGRRANYADALHQTGRRKEAKVHFAEAELMQAEVRPENPLLYSLGGFQYCELLMTRVESAAWRQMLDYDDSFPLPKQDFWSSVSHRAAQSLEWALTTGSLVDIARDRLTLSRVRLYRVMLSQEVRRFYDSELSTTLEEVVNGLRRAGQMDELPRGLLTRSWLRFLGGIRTGRGSTHEDLDEAWEVSERGPMRLHMADIHLYRARLFFREKEEYPWESPESDLKAAEKLINECGYHRRVEELAYAKRVILGKSA